jgi:translocation and assembly module TamB
MKYLIKITGLFLISCLFVVSVSLVILQTEQAKTKVRDWLISTAAAEGLPLHIDHVEGILPFKWTLRGVSCDTEKGLSFKAETIKMRIALGPLLYKKLKVSYLAINNAHLTLFDPYFTIPITGNVNSKIHYDANQIAIDFSSDNLCIGKQCYTSFAGSFRASQKDSHWDGSAKLDIENGDFPFQALAELSIDPTQSVAIKELVITAPDSKINGHLEWNFQHSALTGTLFAQSSNFSHFHQWMPGSRLKGSGGLEAHFKGDTFTLHTALHDLNYKDLQAKEIIFDASMFDIFKQMQGKVCLETRALQLNSLFLSQCTLSAHSENALWPFQIAMKGMWKDALEAECTGFWAKKDQELTVQCNDLAGFIFKKPFGLKTPFSIQWSPEVLLVNGCSLKVDEGEFWLDADLSLKKIDLRLKAHHFPIDLLLPSHSIVSMKGYTSIDASLSATEENTQGRVNFLLEGLNISQLGKDQALQAKGHLNVTLNQNTLQFQAGLKAINNQFLEWTGTVPISIGVAPFEIAFDDSRSLSSELVMDGKLEDIFDFINMGSHRTNGQLLAHLFISKNLQAPSIQGTLEIENGSYENEQTGTYITNIQAKALAENDTIYLQSFSGNDEDTGSLEVTGQLLLKPEEKFPYQLTAELSNLGCIRFDSMSSDLSGQLAIFGSSTSALIEGDLTVSKADLEIPDELPIDIPVLPVTYINQPEHNLITPTEPAPLFPLKLDLRFTAPSSTPGQVIVRGRGLRSEWQGKIHLFGTSPNVSVTGSLHLLRGEFAFSGKVFKLTQGEISMIDKPLPTTHLSLSGALELSDVTITALLSGPLDAPRLTFQSSPHLPTSSILARILFNKDISEVSPVQAVQLAHMIMTLSGGAGPDVLEAIRKSLGVDRLNIVSNAGSDEISLQIGKYLTKGVMVTLAQGTDSSQIIVEVELSKGFILQAENQPDQEGKFSLKWNRNY